MQIRRRDLSLVRGGTSNLRVTLLRAQRRRLRLKFVAGHLLLLDRRTGFAEDAPLACADRRDGSSGWCCWLGFSWLAST